MADVAPRIAYGYAPMEYKLLATLVSHAGAAQTHHQLLERVRGPGHENQMQYLRVYMTQLRHKPEREPARPPAAPPDGDGH